MKVSKKAVFAKRSKLVFQSAQLEDYNTQAEEDYRDYVGSKVAIVLKIPWFKEGEAIQAYVRESEVSSSSSTSNYNTINIDRD